MGFLVPILLAVGTLFLGELEGGASTRQPWLVASLMIVPYLHSGLRHRLALAGKLRQAALLSRLAPFLPVLLQAFAVTVLGWMESVETWFDVELSLLAWPRIELLLALAPFVFYSLTSIDADSRASRSSPSHSRQVRNFQARMFLTGLGPIVLYLGLAAALGSWEFLRVGVEEVSLWSLLFTALLAAVFITLLPFFLRWTWETEVLEGGPEAEVLRRVAELANFRCRELLVWKTGNLMANAAIVGLIPRTRRVFFTDALLSQLGPRQLAAVFAHEIGHAKRGHVLIFFLSALAFFGCVDGLLVALQFEQEWMELATLIGSLGLWLLGFGWLSRRIELEADLYCLQLLGDGIGITSALQSVSPASHSKSGWRHFSTGERIEFLGRAAADPRVGRRLRRGLRGVALGALIVLGAVGSWRLNALADAYPQERTLVDLRLGAFEEALTRAAQRTEIPETEQAQGIASLLELIGSHDWPSGDREVVMGRCQELAREALAGSSTETAIGWLSLASLTGDPQAGAAALHLQEHLDGAQAGGPPGEEVGPWLTALERHLEGA